jgi:3-hydroxyisobutyrate dehydrogenase
MQAMPATLGKLGFIGLGSQGAPIARRMLDAGLEVVLWARRPESLAAFTDSGATFASSIAELGAQVTYCGVCVVDDAGVRQVCDELISAMASGSCIAIHSTVHPALCKALAAQAKSRGISLIDAPVSGGGPAAAAGTLTVMVGGECSAVEVARPIFETFAGTIAHLGDVGAGQTTKLVNNTLMAANLALADHALRVADHFGLERDAFVKLIAASSGRSFSFDVRARMSAPTDFKHGARLLAKDVRLLGEAAGNDVAFDRLRDTAASFLDIALAD